MHKFRTSIACLLFLLLLGCSTNGVVEEQFIDENIEKKPFYTSGYRIGPKPTTTDAPPNTNIAHQQTSQNSPGYLQDDLWAFMTSLSGVNSGPSTISVSGARALFVPGTTGPTLAGDERAHIHPAYDGSLHIALDEATMLDLVARGWGEFHPRNTSSIMLYGPRNEEELAFIKQVVATGRKLHTPTDRNEKEHNEEKESEHMLIPFSTQALKNIVFSGNNLALEAIESSNGSYTRYRILYTSNGYRISGILNIPQGDGPFPLIILNHGYIDPRVYTVGRGLKREQDYLARAGYAVLHTDYRNHGLSDKDPAVDANYLFRTYFYTQDSINAILAVQASLLPELASIDSQRVGMLGHSMGGGVTMHALIAQPKLIDAAVLYAPVHSSEWYNFDRWRADDLTQTQKEEREERLGAIDITSFLPYSATPYVDEILSPLQIYFGTKDESVPYQWGVDIQEIFTQGGVNSELITFEGEKHEFTTQWNSFMEGVVSFFDEHL